MAEETDLKKPHHDEVLDRLDSTGGQIAYHSLGSGKTLLGLRAIEKYHKQHGGKALAVVPASLTHNFPEQAKKFKVDIDPSRLEVTTYDQLHKHVNKDYGLVVADEAHKVRNKGTQRSEYLEKIMQKAHKRLLLTATPVYNKHTDIASLVNMAAGKPVLPKDEKGFEEKFVKREKVHPGLLGKLIGVSHGERKVVNNKKELTKVLDTYVHHYDGRKLEPENFATKSHKDIEVEMDKDQESHYRYAEGSIPFYTRMKIRMNLPLDKKESSNLNAFSTGVRQIANTHKAYTKKELTEATPKIKAMADSLERGHKNDKNFRAISYSNYLDSGLHELSKELGRRGVSHSVYTGELSSTEKKKMVDDFNEGKVKTLLLSSSGSEGLNLKGVKKVQIMEPHFNRKKIDQVIGRAVRYKSHDHLPEEERHVEVENYLSKFPKNFLGMENSSKTIDQYLHHQSREKEKFDEQMLSGVKS